MEIAEKLIRKYESTLGMDSKPMGWMTLRAAIRIQMGDPSNPRLPGVNRDPIILGSELKPEQMVLYYEAKYCVMMAASGLAWSKNKFEDAERFKRKADKAQDMYFKCSWDAQSAA